MKWQRHKLGRECDVEAVVRLANPVEPEYPIKIVATVYGPSDDRKDCFGRVDLKMGTSMELFRVYDPDPEKCKTLIDEGLRTLFRDLAKAVQ